MRRKFYIPKHYTPWYLKLLKVILQWEFEAYEKFCGFLESSYNKSMLFIDTIGNYFTKAIIVHDKFWDGLEEKLEELYDDYILSGRLRR